MTRVRLRTGRAALLLALIAAMLVVFLPLRLATGWLGLDALGITARRVGGTVWGGSLRDARFGALPLGDLSAALEPLPLLIGRARVAIESRGVPEGLAGALGVSRGGYGVDDLTGSLPAGGVFDPVPVSRLVFEDVTVRFVGDSCDAAEGRVRADLAGQVAGVAVPASLAGPVRCDGGALLLPLAGAGGEGVAIRLWADGRYRAELTLAPGDPAALARLLAAGFVQGAGGPMLAIEGRF